MRPSPPLTRTAPLRWGDPLVLIVLAGCILRVVQWAAGASLWLDELYLAESILQAGWSEIATVGLRHDQVAPFGFIAVEKIVSGIFGGGERALRLVPLIASLASLVGIAALTRRLLSPRGAWVATAVLAFNPLLISLAGAVKPYALDVLVVIAILLVFDRMRSSSRPLSVWTGAGAGALGLFSVPSVLIVGGVLGSWVLAGAHRHRRVVLAWLTIAGGAALWANVVVTPSVRSFMHDYWTAADAFMPALLSYPSWLVETLRTELVPGLFLRSYVAPGAFPTWALHAGALTIGLGCALGLVRLARSRSWHWAVALALPLVGAAVLSRLALYPLAPRTSVYLLPLAAILIGAAAGGGRSAGGDGPAGSDGHGASAGPFSRWGVIGSLVVLGGVLARDLPPYEVQDTRGLLTVLAERRGPEEPVFGHPYAEGAFLYYGPRLGLTNGITIGSGYEPRPLLIELDQYRGQRAVWVVFTFPTVRGDARSPMLCYLSAIGRETDRVVYPGASVHRFDLSDPERLREATANGFDLGVPGRPFDAPPCGAAADLAAP